MLDGSAQKGQARESGGPLSECGAARAMMMLPVRPVAQTFLSSSFFVSSLHSRPRFSLPHERVYLSTTACFNTRVISSLHHKRNKHNGSAHSKCCANGTGRCSRHGACPVSWRHHPRWPDQGLGNGTCLFRCRSDHTDADYVTRFLQMVRRDNQLLRNIADTLS